MLQSLSPQINPNTSFFVKPSIVTGTIYLILAIISWIGQSHLYSIDCFTLKLSWIYLSGAILFFTLPNIFTKKEVQIDQEKYFHFLDVSEPEAYERLRGEVNDRLHSIIKPIHRRDWIQFPFRLIFEFLGFIPVHHQISFLRTCRFLSSQIQTRTLRTRWMKTLNVGSFEEIPRFYKTIRGIDELWRMSAKSQFNTNIDFVCHLPSTVSEETSMMGLISSIATLHDGDSSISAIEAIAGY